MDAETWRFIINTRFSPDKENSPNERNIASLPMPLHVFAFVLSTLQIRIITCRTFRLFKQICFSPFFEKLRNKAPLNAFAFGKSLLIKERSEERVTWKKNVGWGVTAVEKLSLHFVRVRVAETIRYRPTMTMGENLPLARTALMGVLYNQ